MMFKAKLAIFVGALALASSSFAVKNNPDACPGIRSIQAEGMTNSVESEGMYITYNVSKYNTSSNWVFIMGPILANSEERALKEGNKFLSTTSGSPIPEEDSDGSWICQYNTHNSDLAAFAVEADDMISPMSFKKYFNLVRHPINSVHLVL